MVTKKEVPYTITMPEQKFEGILLGGFHIHKKDKEASTNQNFKSKMTILMSLGCK